MNDMQRAGKERSQKISWILTLHPVFGGIDPLAITATAHKLARLVYAMLKNGSAFVDAGEQEYEERYRSRVIKNLKRRAQEMGFQLVWIESGSLMDKGLKNSCL